MNRLILIKHAAPEVNPQLPPEQWQLSDRGRESCKRLAHKLRPHAPAIIVSSHEPKAQETAELLAAALAVPHKTAANLHEHDRSKVPHMRSAEFISMMELLFRRPDELVLGDETADQALSRFEQAIQEVVLQHPQQTVAIVSHGTVIALFLSKIANTRPFQLWRDLGLPSMAILEGPEWTLVELVKRID